MDGRTGEGWAASVRFVGLYWIIKSVQSFFPHNTTTLVICSNAKDDPCFRFTVLSRKTTASIIDICLDLSDKAF